VARGGATAKRRTGDILVVQITVFLQLRANRRGGARATVVEIDIATCPAFAGRPSGRKFLRRRDIQRRDALLQVPKYCGDHHLSRSEGTLANFPVSRGGPDHRRGHPDFVVAERESAQTLLSRYPSRDRSAGLWLDFAATRTSETPPESPRKVISRVISAVLRTACSRRSLNVAQTFLSAVSPTFLSAAPCHVPKRPVTPAGPAGLEACDTAGLETCATV